MSNDPPNNRRSSIPATVDSGRTRDELAGPVYGEECVLTADLDWADLARAPE